MKPKLDDDDATLFREAVRDVKPLSHDQPGVTPRRRPPRARFARAAGFAVLEADLSPAESEPIIAEGEALTFRRSGVAESVVRKLRRGGFGIAGELDLHGLTVTQATQALGEFLAAALAHRARCVRIIHGKGLRSGHGGPVLKGVVSGILRRTSAVVAFVSARPEDGGTGATYVLLAG